MRSCRPSFRFPNAKKRPADMKTKQWKSVPYARDKKSNYTGQKIDRSTWQRTLWDLIPKNDKALVNLLRKDGALPKWEGKTCPRCGTGKLSALQPGKVGAMLTHRRNAKGCQTYINPHHLHPLFVDGKRASSLQQQAAALLLSSTARLSCFHPSSKVC